MSLPLFCNLLVNHSPLSPPLPPPSPLPPPPSLPPPLPASSPLPPAFSSPPFSSSPPTSSSPCLLLPSVLLSVVEMVSTSSVDQRITMCTFGEHITMLASCHQQGETVMNTMRASVVSQWICAVCACKC